MSHQYRIPTYYLPQLAALLEQWHVDISPILTSQNLSTKQISMPGATLGSQQYVGLIEAAVAQSPLPEIGLAVGRNISIGSHGQLGLALLNCSDLSEALDFIQRYLYSRAPLLKMQFEKGGDLSVFSFDLTLNMGSGRVAYLETSMLAVVNLIVFLSSRASIERINFDFPEPDYAGKYSDYFNHPVYFEQEENGVVLNTEYLVKHFDNADPVALEQAKQACEQELQSWLEKNGKQTFSEQVRSLLYKNRHHLPSLPELADMLYVTPRTLHRRLLSENTNFKQLLDSVKSDIAKDFLGQPGISVSEIAFMLGYENTANFRRAFKRWYAISPSEYRDKLKAEQKFDHH